MIRATTQRISPTCRARMVSILDEIARQAPALLSEVSVRPDSVSTVVNLPGRLVLLRVAFDHDDKPTDVVSALVLRLKDMK